MDLRRFPKIELHLHLDCSLSYDVVRKIDPGISLDEYRQSFVAPPKCTDLADYLLRAVRGFQLMQTEEQLRLVVADLFSQLKEDNIIYAEIRFAPLLHLQQGLEPIDVVSIVNDAVEKSIAETGIDAGILLCTLRHFSEAQSMMTAGLVDRFKGTNVVGFDIAGDEAGFPINAHKKAFDFANAQGISCTAHAGEACGAASVWETLQNFHPSRIGHGVRSAEDDKLLHWLAQNNIHLEVCPTSNIQTNVYDRIEDHSLPRIFNAGVSMSINTDCRTISDVSLTSEYERVMRVFEWGKQQFLKCNLEAIRHSFATLEKKAALERKIVEWFEAN